MSTETLERVLPDTLTGFDRCDACGAQAYVLVLMETGELNFCSHHYTAFEAKVSDLAVKVLDERYKLDPQPRTISEDENAF